MKPPPLPDEFRALMMRYNQLGRLLPAEDCFDTDDAMAVADAKLVLLEMKQGEAATRVFLPGWK
jgi:hypothetical protein